MTNNEAILRRFRELLQQKRDTFQHYLLVLENQESDIERNDLSALEQHIRLETEVLEQLSAVSRVIVPLQKLGIGAEENDLAPLNASIETLRERIGEQHAKNRDQLSRKTEDLARRIDQLNIPLRARSVYSPGQSASLVNMVL